MSSAAAERTSALAAGAVILALAGCWSQPVSVETESLGTTAPGPDARGPAAEDAAPDAPPDAGGARREEPELPPAPVLAEPPYTPPPTLWRRLDSGLTLVSRETPAGPAEEAARVRLTLPVGMRRDEPGLAELTAWMVAEIPGGSEGRPALRTALESAGAELTIRLGVGTTSFDVAVDAGGWRRALDELARAVRRPPRGRQQIEEARARLLGHRRRELGTPGLEPLIERVTRRRGQAAREYVAALEDRAREEIERFHGEHYRPSGAVVALRVPGVAAAAVLEEARAKLGAWAAPGAARDPDAVRPKPAVSVPEGLVWHPTEAARSRLALILPVPRLGLPADLEGRLCLELFTSGGVGGRLGEHVRRLAPYEVPFRGRALEDGVMRFLVLTTSVPPAWVPAIREAARRARASLAEDPPSTEEVRAAAERVRLAILDEESDPGLWLGAITARALLLDQPLDHGPLLERLQRVSREPLDEAYALFRGWPTAMVVVGGRPPADAGESITVVEDAFLGGRAETIPVDIWDQVKAAVPYLDRAIAAVGGAERLYGVRGYHTVCARTSPRGAVVEDRVWFAAPDRLRRVRRVLATRIETTVRPGTAATERSGRRTVTLDASEVQSLLREAARHPLMLLSSYLRGDSYYRLAAVRGVGDRRIAILELQDPERERLRIGIDTQSGLVRKVETREWRPGIGSPVYVEERFEDYRSVDGVRVPFRITTTVDDGPAPVETKVWSFAPGAPADEAFR